MGYTHNWKISLPPERQHDAMQAIEIELRARFGKTMSTEMDDDGTLILHSLDGVSDGFRIDGSWREESCKSGRGLAELEIAELLWRTSEIVFAHGGEMVIHSDWTYGYNDADLDDDAKLALAVLMARCEDLIRGKTLTIRAVPRAWPGLPDPYDRSRGLGVRERMMKDDYREQGSARQLVFGIDIDGDVNFDECHEYGSLKFDFLVTRHIQAEMHRLGHQIRGFLFCDLAVYLDGRLIAGQVPRSDAVVTRHTKDLTLHGFDPKAWLAEEVQRRKADELEQEQP